VVPPGKIPTISFDVFIQAFHDGDAAVVDPTVVLREFSHFSVEPVTSDSQRIQTADGDAEIFGLDSAADGFMLSHASGSIIWDAVVRVAEVAGMAIIPVGCPACVTRAELVEHLPDELKEDVRVVETGRQLVASFR
jgi:hypothetical protein